MLQVQEVAVLIGQINVSDIATLRVITELFAKVMTFTAHSFFVWWKVLMAFLHNRAAESHEILSECSHQ